MYSALCLWDCGARREQSHVHDTNSVKDQPDITVHFRPDYKFSKY